MDNSLIFELGGPGAPPQPWSISGSTISYDGAILLPGNVQGGNTGSGTINVNNLYVKGVQVVNPVGNYLPLTGGTVTGILSLLNLASLSIPGGASGQILATTGGGSLYWTSALPGGAYLPLAGGTLSGALNIATPTNLVMGGGGPGQILSTDGAGHLSWIIPNVGSVIDAPSDGTTYGRKNAAWSHLTISDITNWTTPVTMNATAPVSPAAGSLWWDANGGQLYVYYNDGNSSQWVPTTNQFGGGYLQLGGGTLTGPLTGTSATFTSVSAPQAIGDNRIINGDMRIDQRNNGVSGTASGYTVDRWRYDGAQASKGGWIRAVFSGLGFPYALSFSSSSAYSLLTGDFFSFSQPIEADAVSDFQWGTANAQPVTLSFIALSILTGTFGGSIRNTAGTRSYPFTFSLPIASTPTKITITIPGDTSGTWVMSGNAAALNLNFSLGVGATFSGTAGAWAGANYISATGAVSVVGTNAATFYITGVKLEVGSIATPFNRQSLTKSMADCQRYYEVCIGYWVGDATVGTSYFVGVPYAVEKRASPTLTSIAQAGGANGGFGVRTGVVSGGQPTRTALWGGTTAAATGPSRGFNDMFSATAEL